MTLDVVNASCCLDGMLPLARPQQSKRLRVATLVEAVLYADHEVNAKRKPEALLVCGDAEEIYFFYQIWTARGNRVKS